MLPSRAAIIVIVSFTGAVFGAPFPASADDSDLARIEAMLQAQEGLRAAKRLQNTFSQYRSEGLWNDLGAVLTADARGIPAVRR